MASTLDGITVLDLTTGPAGALATMFLADHGARVIRLIESERDLHRDGGYVIWDRAKECATLDLDAAVKDASSEARTFDRLVAGADILVEEFAPSSPGQALAAPARLRPLNPRLIACSITAFGKVGPLKDEPPIDDLVLAKTGVLSGMPGFRPAPVHVVHPLPSVGAAMLALNGIAAALLARETTGRGRFVSTSLMAGALLYHPKVIGERLTRHVFQTHPSGSAPFYSNYQCADGRWIQLGCVHVNFIAIAAGLFGIGELIKEPRFDKGRGGKTPDDDRELRATIAGVINTKPLATWAAEFEAADVPFAPCQDSEQGLSDSQVLHNKMVCELHDPAVGPVTQMGVPVRLSETPGRIKGPRAARAVPAESLQLAAVARSTPASASTGSELDPPPLAGVRILEITNLIAGPTGGRILADLGADVIKLEPPEGDMSRPIGRTYFYSVNFNKRSISVDTRQTAGKEVVQKIAASADAMLANLRPGATARMGISAKVNPKLIETHLTGYGLTGPYSKRPGIDPLAQAYMGLQRAQGGPENPPVFPAQLAPTDYTNGAMGAFGTILALYARKRTGVAQTVDSDLLGGGVVLSSAWFSKYRGKPVRPLADKGQYGLSPFHRLFKLADGWIYVAARSAAEERAIADVAGLSAEQRAAIGSTAAGQHPNDTRLAHALAEAYAKFQVAPILATLKAAGVAAIACEKGDSEVFLDDPHSLANDMVAVRQHPTGGEIKVAWQWIQFADTKPSAGRATPLLGEHSGDVLREVGYSDEAIAALRRDGTIKIESA